jgi:hypothetical protein
MLRRAVATASLALVFACNRAQVNPFASVSRAPSADSVIAFVSASWATDAGQPRELLAITADGSKVERLTGCAQNPDPCDMIQVSFGPDRNRIAAVRGSTKGDPSATALYFMDLARSVEKLLFSRRRVVSVDWSAAGGFLLYSSPGDTGSAEDLWTCQPDATQDQNLTNTPGLRERSGRVDAAAQTAVFELIDATGVGRIVLFPAGTPLTSGPAAGPALPNTPYVVGGDADPVFSPDFKEVAFRRLTALGTWDLLAVKVDGTGLRTIATGGVFIGPADWSSRGIAFVETDAAAALSRLVVVQADGSGRQVVRTESAAFNMGTPRWIP